MSLFGYAPQSEVDNLLDVNEEMESQIAGLKSTLAALKKKQKEKVDGLKKDLKDMSSAVEQAGKDHKALEKLRLKDHATYQKHYAELKSNATSAEQAEDDQIAKASSLEGTLKEVQGDNDNLRSKNDNLRSILSKVKSRGEKYKGQVEELNKVIKNGTKENDALKLQVENLQKMVASKDGIIQSFTTLTQAHIFVGPATKKRKNDLALCD